MKNIAALFGSAAEKQACDFLRQQGLDIITRNYACRWGEIDVIAKDRQTLVFVEVRFRGNSSRGNAAESITSTKQKRIIKAAGHYLATLQTEPACRFDVVAIDKTGKTNDFRWIRNAFTTDQH